ncbi:MAG TPA: CPBP family intramembrane glutamic endopeptidase [Rhizomicrobium sp.]|nr:CPBP family intramembrane glutamic endopeptidase [Rhizomicrobium sp.]
MPAATETPSTLRDIIARRLSGFGPLGTLVFVAICAVSALFAPGAALLVLLWTWASRTPWREIGLVRPGSWLNGLLIGIALGLAEKLLLKAVILPLLGAPPVNAMIGDLSANPKRALFLIFYVMIGAAFCEELVFRGFLFQRLGRLLGDGAPARIAIVLLSTAFFASLHFQQGPSGIENAAIGGAITGAVYVMNHRRLWTVIVAHATFDLSAIALNYYHLEAALAHSVFK